MAVDRFISVGVGQFERGLRWRLLDRCHLGPGRLRAQRLAQTEHRLRRRERRGRVDPFEVDDRGCTPRELDDPTGILGRALEKIRGDAEREDCRRVATCASELRACLVDVAMIEPHQGASKCARCLCVLCSFDVAHRRREARRRRWCEHAVRVDVDKIDGAEHGHVVAVGERVLRRDRDRCPPHDVTIGKRDQGEIAGVDTRFGDDGVVSGEKERRRLRRERLAHPFHLARRRVDCREECRRRGAAVFGRRFVSRRGWRGFRGGGRRPLHDDRAMGDARGGDRRFRAALFGTNSKRWRGSSSASRAPTMRAPKRKAALPGACSERPSPASPT